MQETASGKFARDYIDNLDLCYSQKRYEIEANPLDKTLLIEKPFDEIQMVCNDFFTNESLTDASTMVTGDSLCKMLDVCLFLAEQLE